MLYEVITLRQGLDRRTGIQRVLADTRTRDHNLFNGCGVVALLCPGVSGNAKAAYRCDRQYE